MDKYSFQICQKIVVFSKDHTKVLLCKRKGEPDFNGIFSKIETIPQMVKELLYLKNTLKKFVVI